MAVGKTELVDHVAENAGLTKVQAAKAVDEVLTGIQSALNKGDQVVLRGFGSFRVKERAARKGRNPRTGEEMQIAASKYVSFKPSK